MKFFADYPKSILIVRSDVMVQLGIRPEYTCEVIDSAIRHKVIHLRADYNDKLSAPHGYRLYRVWRGNSACSDEISLP